MQTVMVVQYQFFDIKPAPFIWNIEFEFSHCIIRIDINEVVHSAMV